ncbi:response regulator transcription factor [Umezawaea beigongshangensis]|uniref:response regulator n=1 Tax=Umezawaea beigongshangensis TaxID=2780383 RepID=UPI0018F20E42
MTKVFLVDDHEIVRRGVADLLDGEPDLEVVGGAGSVAEALALVPDSGADVAVLDIRLPDGSGIELCRELAGRAPGVRCLMLTSYADDDALFDAVVAGAAGFVLKQVLGGDLVRAVRAVGAGRSLLDASGTSALLDRIRGERERSDPLRALSDQERAVLDLIAEGLTNRQIAERMSLAEKTVKNYVSHVLAKLGLQRRTQAAVLASRTGSARPGP